jgi:hypothetical protein
MLLMLLGHQSWEKRMCFGLSFGWNANLQKAWNWDQFGYGLCFGPVDKAETHFLID